MSDLDPFKDFTERLKLLASKHPMLITTTLSNILKVHAHSVWTAVSCMWTNQGDTSAT